jgi:hypothetical protein
MERAKIISKKSISATLMAMPIGVEQVISSSVFSRDQIQKRAFELKTKGYEFIVTSPRGLQDIYVTRVK